MMVVEVFQLIIAFCLAQLIKTQTNSLNHLIRLNMLHQPIPNMFVLPH